MERKELDLTNLPRKTKTNGSLPKEIQSLLGLSSTSKQRLCDNIDLHIDRHGTWYYQGSPIKRKELVKLFSKALRRDAQGNHWLVTPAEIVSVRVEDVAHIVVGMDVTGIGEGQTVRFRTLVDTTYNLSESHPLRVDIDPKSQQPTPYLKLENGLEARLNRAVFFDLANSAIETEMGGTFALGLWSAGSFHVIGDAIKI